MRATILRTAISGALAAALVSSCIIDPNSDTPPPPKTGEVTIVVSAPPSSGSGGATRAATGSNPGGNGHFPDGVPADYRNYNADADPSTYGTTFGGYPDADAESAAFDRAVTAMAANYENSPAAKTRAANPSASPTPATRAITEGSREDNHIEDITVLMFDDNGVFVSMTQFDETQLSEEAGNGSRLSFTLEDLENGNYKALILANAEDCNIVFDDVIMGQYGIEVLDEDFLRGKNIDEVREKLVVRAPKWNSEPGTAGYKDFPMSSKVVELTVPSQVDYSLNPIELVRMLAKINVTTSITGFEIVSVTVGYNRLCGYLVPADGWRRGLTFSETNMGDFIDEHPMGFADPDLNNLDGYFGTYRLDSDDNNKLIDEIFIFEMFKRANHTDGLGLLIAAKMSGVFPDDAVRYFRINVARNTTSGPELLDIVRNYKYDVDIAGCNTLGYATPAEAWNHPDELVTTVNASEQEGSVDVTWNGMYQLTTDRSIVVVPAGGEAKLKIYTDYDNGWSIYGNSGVTVKKDNVTISSQPKNNENVPHEVTLGFAYPNTSAAVSLYTFQLIAGELHKTITVVRLPSAGDVMRVTGGGRSNGITPYVGAFWRADQTGERLIGLTPGERWSAFVLDAPADTSADWVRMDTKPSTDTDVLTGGGPALSGNDTAFDATYPVNSTVAWATGDGDEPYFRLGARSHFAPTYENPAARYATVLVVPGSISDGGYPTNPAEYKLLYLRQGHEADHLFSKAERPMDANVRFSPYNLTVPTDKPFGANGSVQLDPQGGAWTAYPTQAGAFFQFSSATQPRVAWHPTTPATPSSGWNSTDENLEFNPVTMETCPPGYRRPTGGLVHQNALPDASHEIAFSLWRNHDADHNGHNNDNAFYGYYADGFFDRRVVDGPYPTREQASKVSSGAEVAYEGMVMFNDNPASSQYGASIFFPFSTYRGDSDGQVALSGNGVGGNFWSSTRSIIDATSRDAFSMSLGKHFYYPIIAAPGVSDHESAAFSVRCVKNPEYESLDGLVPAPPGVIGIKHSDLMALRAGTKHLAPGDYSVVGNQLVSFPLDVSLTIKGSSTYKGTWVERIATDDPNIGSLENEPVYTVYFKWGSTLGMLGPDGTQPSGNVEVVWGLHSVCGCFWHGLYDERPSTDYFGVAYPAYSAIGLEEVYYNPGGYSIPIWENRHMGNGVNPQILGDPCEFVNGGTDVNRSGWKTPVGNPWTYSDGNTSSTPFGGIYSGGSSERSWTSSDISTRWVAASDGVPAGAVSYDGKIFMPAAGYYNEMGQHMDLGTRGTYLTANMGQDQSTHYGGYNIKFQANGVSQRDELDISQGGQAMPIRCIRQVEADPNFVQAAPGMIGIKKSDYDALRRGDKRLGDGTYSLTIRGSSTWKNTPVANNTNVIPSLANLGGLEDEPVYAVYFKWGSTVAMVGGPNGDPYDKSKVVWVNPEYLLGQYPISNNYGSFTSADNKTNGMTNPTPYEMDVVENLRVGHGDPCRWVNGNTSQSRYTAAGGWRTPTAQDNLVSVGTHSVNVYLGQGPYYTYNAAGGTPSDPSIGTITNSGVSFPLAGSRAYSANSPQGMTGAGSMGYYWTTSGYYANSAAPSGSRTLLALSSFIIHSYVDAEYGNTVRCMPDKPGVRVPRGVIGYYADGPNAGQLTLDGDKSFYGDTSIAPEQRSTQRQHTVYAAYFKWGSLVALDSSDEGDGFTGTDIVAVPAQYYNSTATENAATGESLNKLRSQVLTAGSGTNGYNLIQPLTGLAAGATIPWAPTATQLQQAHGDPCAYYFNNEWMMPRHLDNIDLIGSSFTSKPQAGTVIDPHLAAFGSDHYTLAASGWRGDTNGVPYQQGTQGRYWSSTAPIDSNAGNNLYFDQGGAYHAAPGARIGEGSALPIRCLNYVPIEKATINAVIQKQDESELPLTTDPDLTLGTKYVDITLTVAAILPTTATAPQWHWEYTIGDDTSWMKVPNSDNRQSIKASTHENRVNDTNLDIDVRIVGGRNRFRVVASNKHSSVVSDAFSISMRLPTLTYAIIGSGTYSWMGAGRTTALTAALGTGGVLHPDNNNAIVKSMGLTELWTTSNISTAVTNINNALYSGINKPDIILYFAYGASPTAALGTSLANYINAGGAVIYGTSDNYGPQTTTMFAQIFGSQITAVNRSTRNPSVWSNTIYEINDLPDDPIVNGPFGNLSGGGKFIGDENSGSVFVPTLPPGSIQICSMYTPRAGSTLLQTDSFVWYNTDYNFFYIGDSTNCQAFSGTPTFSATEYPAIYNSNTGMPLSKLFGRWDSSTYGTATNPNGSRMVYNAVLEMNALAWCMSRAATNGINEH